MTVPITVLAPPAPRDGDYLDTLEQWGNLPQYLPLPDAARLIGHKCKQNPAAIRKILEEAVIDNAIPFAGLHSSGDWVPDMLRFFHRTQGKPRVKPNDEGAQWSAAIESAGRLHSEAVGVQIGDAVALLAKRGRRIPDELRHMLPETEPAPGDAPTAGAKKRGRKPSIAPERLAEILDALEHYAAATGQNFERQAMPGPLGEDWDERGSFHWLCAQIDPAFKRAKTTFEKQRYGLCALAAYAKPSDFYKLALPHIAPKLGRR